MDDDDALVLAGYDSLLGARGLVRPKRRGGVPAQRIAPARAQVLRRMASDLPSASGRVMRQFLGLPAFQFVNAGATSIQQTTRPQRSIQIDRVVATVMRSVATLQQLVRITQFKIGAEDMLAGNDALPIEMFAANVTSGRFQGYTAKAGIDVVMTVSITGTALAVGETINVAVGAYGDAVAG